MWSSCFLLKLFSETKMRGIFKGEVAIPTLEIVLTTGKVYKKPRLRSLGKYSCYEVYGQQLLEE